MRRIVRWLAVLLILIAVGAVLRRTLFRADPVPVTVFVAARGRVEETVSNSKAGSVRARQRARLSPQTGGRVAALPVREGQRVRKGDVLLRLDDTEQRARLTLAERALDAAGDSEKQACLDAGLADREFRRTQRLHGEKIATDEMLDRATIRSDVARAACSAAGSRASEARAQVRLARAELDKTVLRAPFDGILAELSTELGEWITPSPPGIMFPPVLDLIDPGSIYVSAPLDEVDVARVHVGQPLRITLDAHPGREFPGRLERIAPYVLDIEGESRTFEIEAVLDDAEFSRTLPPGASADVEVILDVREDVLRVPSYALLEDRKVLLLRDGTLVARETEVGLRNWEFAEIRSGLEERDLVVVSLDRAEVTEGVRARQEAVAER